MSEISKFPNPVLHGRDIENMDEFVIDKYVAPYPSQPTTSPNDYWYSTTTTPINNTLTPLTLVYNSIEDLVDELN